MKKLQLIWYLGITLVGLDLIAGEKTYTIKEGGNKALLESPGHLDPSGRRSPLNNKRKSLHENEQSRKQAKNQDRTVAPEEIQQPLVAQKLPQEVWQSSQQGYMDQQEYIDAKNRVREHMRSLEHVRSLILFRLELNRRAQENLRAELSKRGITEDR